jgi:hypothetical protein
MPNIKMDLDHYTATVIVTRVDRPVAYDYKDNQIDNSNSERQVTEVGKVTVRAGSLTDLIERTKKHVELIDE